jgi:chromatin segregation and condensation protein Rec8/ScpA/Scc1 (kleisin family)
MAPRLSEAQVQERNLALFGVVAPPPIHVQTPAFEGSLVTLFRCVRDRKVELLDVPLLPICEAYFEYLLEQAETNIDEAAAALVALSYLLERKAWMLLPTPEAEPELEEPAELIEPTAHEYRLAIQVLEVWQQEREQWFFRSPDCGPNPYELPYQLKNASPVDLARALERLLRRASPDEAMVAKPRRALSEVMREVLLRVSSTWRPLEMLVDEPYTRTDAVYTFLALLELIRLGQVALRSVDDVVEFARG